ncbi:MAG: hypothetical protein Q9210_002051 [Variospora velana]
MDPQEDPDLAEYVGNAASTDDDESNTLSLPTSPPTPARTTWTLLIYLTGPSTGCVGGETVFYPEQSGPTRKFSGKKEINEGGESDRGGDGGWHGAAA